MVLEFKGAIDFPVEVIVAAQSAHPGFCAVCDPGRRHHPLRHLRLPRFAANPQSMRKPPITATGYVDSGPVPFQDITKAAGLSGWKHTMGNADKRLIIDTNGSGVGLIDYDNDGWLDIYMVNGSTFDALDGKEEPPHAALFHNNHDGTFTDVAAKAGVTNDRWGFGVAIADYDNDGWPDIFVTNWGKNRLYHNNHDGTFTDVAEKAGVTLGNWSAGATWGDYDGDGRLDLFISGYVHFDRNNLPYRAHKGHWILVLRVSRRASDVRPSRTLKANPTICFTTMAMEHSPMSARKPA